LKNNEEPRARMILLDCQRDYFALGIDTFSDRASQAKPLPQACPGEITDIEELAKDKERRYLLYSMKGWRVDGEELWLGCTGIFFYPALNNFPRHLLIRPTSALKIEHPHIAP